VLSSPTQGNSSPAALIGEAQRITVKVGSSLLVEADGISCRKEWMRSLAEEIAGLKAQGKKIVLVSSGAVALGRSYLNLKSLARLEHKQAAAAAGQFLMMQGWEEAFRCFGIPVAQLLLTPDDSERRRRWLNARATLEELLSHSAVPIVNENDSVATDELRYGDNDRLSARTAQMIRADLLVLLSDVDGLYTANPATSASAIHVPLVENLESVATFASGPDVGGMGSGGMQTKLIAARIAQGSGCATIIACGKASYPLREVLNGARSTVFTARGTPGSAYKQWIRGTLSPAGVVIVDDGAAAALTRGKSLLPAGITAAVGSFERGSCVAIHDPRGREVARGLVVYSSDDISKIIGCETSEIEAKLTYRRADEVVHRNDMVLM
jgi:glutamate 5-kinase